MLKAGDTLIIKDLDVHGNCNVMIRRPDNSERGYQIVCVNNMGEALGYIKGEK